MKVFGITDSDVVMINGLIRHVYGFFFNVVVVVVIVVIVVYLCFFIN